jgi:hypothetical protein
MISYCVAAYRPVYARQLIEDLIRKTTVPFEILVWFNVADEALERALQELVRRRAPVRIVGRTPTNIGMRAYRSLFEAARYPLITQIDDDVVCVSRGIAERAAAVFRAFPSVRQIVADVWQDELTTGARPPLGHYRCVSQEDGLYDGPIDGWFSVYHRSILPVLLSIPYAPYCCIGGSVQVRLRRRRLLGVLCTHMKVFHVIGPDYASAFGMLDFEREKYRRLGRADIVAWYAADRPDVPPAALLEERVAVIRAALDGPGPW